MCGLQFSVVQCSAGSFLCLCLCLRWLVLGVCERRWFSGKKKKYLVANEMPRVRFPDGAFSYAALLAGCREDAA